LQHARIEAEEWKHKSKNLANTFLETLKLLKDNLGKLKRDSQDEICIAKDHFEAKLQYLESLSRLQ
jgi:gas vesicle protein